MTGFGRSEKLDTEHHIQVDLKSVNNRYNDIIIKMPWQLKPFEDSIRKIIKSRLKRGRIEVYIKVERATGSKTNIQLDMELAKAYYNSLIQIGDEFNLATDKALELIARFPDVVKQIEEEEKEEILFEKVKNVLLEAVEKLMEMRKIEGEELKNDIVKRSGLIMDMTDKIEEHVPKIVEEHKQKLQVRIKELLDGIVPLDENKFANEVAYFADKTNITEEIVRMKSHLNQLDDILNASGGIGRKLDFLIQEMNREANTIGSKVSDIDVTNYVIEMKSEIEKIREQIQNLE
jgi:uncharacterized protein (TIGR00255 family)